eukprot:g714.t1
MHGTSVQFERAKSSEKFAKIGASFDDLKKQKKDPGKNLSGEDSETGASKEKESLEDDCDEMLPKEGNAEEEDACMCFEHVAEDARLYANAPPSEFCPAYPTLQNQRALRYVFQNAALIPQNLWSKSVNEAEKIYLDPWLYNLKGAGQVEAEFTVKSISKRDCSSASSFIIDRTNIMQNAHVGHEVGDNSSSVSAHDSAMKDDVRDHMGSDVDGRNDDGGMEVDNSVNSDRKHSDNGSAESMDSDELLLSRPKVVATMGDLPVEGYSATPIPTEDDYRYISAIMENISSLAEHAKAVRKLQIEDPFYRAGLLPVTALGAEHGEQRVSEQSRLQNMLLKIDKQLDAKKSGIPSLFGGSIKGTRDAGIKPDRERHKPERFRSYSQDLDGSDDKKVTLPFILQRDEYLRRVFRRRIDSNLEISLFFSEEEAQQEREERRMSSKGFKRDTSALLQESLR